MTCLLGVRNFENLRLVSEVGKISMGSAWGTIFEKLILGSVQFERYRLPNVKSYLKYALGYDTNNVLLNAISVISIILTYLVLVIPI